MAHQESAQQRAESIHIIYYNYAENSHSLLPDGQVIAGVEEKQPTGK